MNPNVQAAQNALTSFQGGKKSSNDILNDAMSRYGVQGAQTTANNLESTINNTTAALNALPAQVQGRTSRSLVTQAQLGGITNEEAAPIQQALASQQAEYGTATNKYKDLLGEAQTFANANISDQQNKEAQLEKSYEYAVNQAAAEQAAQQKAAEDAEARREFNVTAAQSRQKLSSSASSNPIGSISQIQSGLLSVRGGDGYVSPQDYAKAMADFMQVGGSKSQFDQMFGSLKNPKNGYYSYAQSQIGL